ncbi:MAG TPA: HAD-IA family hydrolase [Mycobacterium sp.]|nr:HAD-IA family hydrolase [Mycobacterium sp.]
MVPSVKAVLFDFSGTLARLEDDDTWFDGTGLDAGQRAEVMDRLTHPTVAVDHHAWGYRDLDTSMHREAYLHVLLDAGLAVPHAESLYARCIDPNQWTVYPDTVAVLDGLRANGIRTAVVSNIAWDVRSVLVSAGTDADEYVLSYQVGVAKPDRGIFEVALSRLGVDAGHAVMVGDSVENDGAAAELGCGFVLVDPLPVADRPTALLDALHERGIHT